jgi:hypothetical protein
MHTRKLVHSWTQVEQKEAAATELTGRNQELEGQLAETSDALSKAQVLAKSQADNVRSLEALVADLVDKRHATDEQVSDLRCVLCLCIPHHTPGLNARAAHEFVTGNPGLNALDWSIGSPDSSKEPH